MKAWPTLLAAVAYVAAGVVFAELAGRAASPELVRSWRLAAWGASAVIFLAHLAHERVRSGARPIVAARRAATAVAAGAFGVAAIALVRQLAGGTGRPFLMAIALVAWPLVAGVPAFLAGWGLVATLFRNPPDRR